MSLRTAIQSRPETVQEFRLAAEERYWEAFELMVSGRIGGGLYLLGYVAEMLLKCAFVMLTARSGPAALIEPRLAPARRQGRRLIAGIPDENYHSVQFWARLIVAQRRYAGYPLEATVAARLLQRGRRLHGNWMVTLRYHPDVSGDWEREAVLADVSWIRENYRRLWS